MDKREMKKFHVDPKDVQRVSEGVSEQRGLNE
jgi:hypothetical protein